MNLQDTLTKYFLRYAAVTSQSDAAATSVPSTEGQRTLAELLKKDLAALGVVELEISEYSVLTGKLPGNLPVDYKKVPSIGWVAHLDTVNINQSPEVHPVVHKNYQGGDLVLNEKRQLVMKAAEHPELAKYIGSDVITSDGTSVLGADNKAAIANLMTTLEVLHNDDSILHGDIYLAFVPDEEIGLRGSKKMDFSKFPVDYAYTIDCCELGEVVYQTFNAGGAQIKIQGVTAHPMSAKGVLVNPALVAVDFINQLDRRQTPECTEGVEGFIWVESMQTNVSQAVVNLKIRDHDKAKYEEKKAFLWDVLERTKEKNPKAKVEMTITDVYGNIADAITEKNKECIDNIFTGMKELGITPKDIAMRGGTDGSFISTKGILTPNYFTGAHNFHSIYEFMPMDAVEKSCQLTLKLIELAVR